MTTPTEPGFGRARTVWRALGRSGRTAVSLATALIVAAGAVAVIAGMPRGGIPGAGAGFSSLEPIPSFLVPIPTNPTAPSGWHFTEARGNGDDPGGLWNNADFSGLGLGEHVLAVHAVCQGPDELMVLLGSGLGEISYPTQAAHFMCSMSGEEGRVIFTSTGEPFGMLSVVVIRNPASLAKDSWVVSLEAPDASPPTASPPTAGPSR